MRRTYTYDNAVINITIPNSAIINIHKATNIFLHKVIKESQNGNSIKTRTIKEK